MTAYGMIDSFFVTIIVDFNDAFVTKLYHAFCLA